MSGHKMNTEFDQEPTQYFKIILVTNCFFLYIWLLGWREKMFRGFMFEFPCIVSLYYIRNQLDASLAVFEVILTVHR